MGLVSGDIRLRTAQEDTEEKEEQNEVPQPLAMMEPVSIEVVGLAGEFVAALQMPSSETVRGLKRCLHESTGVPANSQMLVAGPGVLDDAATLASFASLEPSPVLVTLVVTAYGRRVEVDPAEFCVDAADVEVLESAGSGFSAEILRGRFRGEDIAVRIGHSHRPPVRVEDLTTMHCISHENLVRFLGVAQGKQQWLLMEYCAGDCLFDLLHNRYDFELEWSQQLKMALDVAAAVDYLHHFQPKIIVRGLITQKLLLSGGMSSKSDVPLVKLSCVAPFKEESWWMSRGSRYLTHWAAPELISGAFGGSDGDASEKLDVYSYAMVLFEIICRDIPFEELEPPMALRAVCAGDRPDMEAVPPNCPLRLSDLMTSCWAQDPSARPSFERIVELLEAVSVPPVAV